MAEPTRPLTIGHWPEGPSDAVVIRLSGHEALSEPFRFTLDLLVRRGEHVPFDRVLGQALCVTLQRGSSVERHFSGVVSRFGQTGYDDRFDHYRAVVTPEFDLLRHRVQSRVFQDRSVGEVLRMLLADLAVAYELTGTYPQRNYCVQYRESDFAFASRLMEAEGIRYYFRHRGDGHQMVLADDPRAHPQLDPRTVIYDPEANTPASTRVGIHDWECNQTITPSRWSVWDDHFEASTRPFKGSMGVAETTSLGKGSTRLRAGFNAELDARDGPAGFAPSYDAIAGDGQKRPAALSGLFAAALPAAQRRCQETAVSALDIGGKGNDPRFCPGSAFDLERHADADGRYYLTKVEHRASQPAPHSGEQVPFRYENEFRCLPDDLPYRPAQRTRRPSILGVQTAVVVGPAKQPTHLDPHGRVRLQFRWANGGDGQSCWVRVAQVWAGKGWGACFWPRIGHEVAVVFEEGDPDRPLVVGSLYNGTNLPPFELPDGALIAGVKSCSASPDVGPQRDFNGLLFYDAVGKEHVQVHSQREDATTGESSRLSRVGRDQMRVAGGLNIPGTVPAKDFKPEEVKNPETVPAKGAAPKQEKKRDPFRSYLQKTASQIFGVPGQMLDFVVGAAGTGVLGASGWNVVGSNTEIFVDPISLLGQAFQSVSKFNGNIAGRQSASAVGASAGLLLGIGAAFGKTTIHHGTVASLNYGPLIDIQRGNRVVWHGAPLTLLAQAGSLAVNLLAMGINVATPVAADNLKWGVAMEIVKQSLLGLLVSQEAALAYVGAAQAANFQSLKWSQLANTDLENAKRMIGVPHSADLANLAKLEAEEGVLSANQAIERARETTKVAEQLRSVQAQAFEGNVDTSELRAGDFGVHARNVNLLVNAEGQVFGTATMPSQVNPGQTYTLPTTNFIPKVALAASNGNVEIDAKNTLIIHANHAKVHLDPRHIAIASGIESEVEFSGSTRAGAGIIITRSGTVTVRAGRDGKFTWSLGSESIDARTRGIGFVLSSSSVKVSYSTSKYGKPSTFIEVSGEGVTIQAPNLTLHGDVSISKRAPLSKKEVSGINKDEVSLSTRS